MAMDTPLAPVDSFARRRLPILAGVAGLVVYLITLCHWISSLNLATVADVSGWLWRPDLSRPLALIVLAPFRLLPDAWIPLALNIFTALCASIVLMLLARSVSLLRHDVRPEGSLRRQRGSDLLTLPSAWMAPGLAVTACGLQLSFWECATSATGDMIVLVAFAYALRCILEFRIDPQQKWLSRCAFIYAAAMADSWVLLAYLPVLLGAIIWVKGYGKFLNGRFLLRMTLWALGGLSLYLVPSVLRIFLSSTEPGFWMTLKSHLRDQEQALLMLTDAPYRLLILTALLPFGILAIRWKSHTIQITDDSRLGVFITRATGHFVHGCCLIVGLWIMLNPVFSPRGVRLADPGLTHYYVWALAIGYCAGYVLTFAQHRVKGVGRQIPVVVIGVLVGFWPVLLVWRNLSEIRITNGSALKTFASELYEGLDDGPSVALSEDPKRLLLLQGLMALAGDEKSPLLVDTTLLTLPGYHKFLNKRYGLRWPQIPDLDSRQNVAPSDLRTMVEQLSKREPIFYLHPSSGHFVEPFVGEPSGSVYRLRPESTNAEERVELPQAVLMHNGELWQYRWDGYLKELARRCSGGDDQPSSLSRTPLDSLQLMKEQNATVAMLGAAYSKSLNDWGVQLQRHDQWADAGVWFRRALQLNPDNLAAAINIAYNERRQAGDISRLAPSWIKDEREKEAEQLSGWWEVIGRYGPVDEPTHLLRTGRILLASNNERQAIQAFSRCLELAPDWSAPKLWLAECRNRLGEFQAALALADDVQSGETMSGPGLAQLLHCRMESLLGLGRTNDVVECLEDFTTLHGDHPQVLSASARIYAQQKHYAEDIELIDTLIKRDPDNPELLGRKGLAELRLGRFDAAVDTLSKALALAPSNDRLLRLRALACVGAGQLESAQDDYLILLKRPRRKRAALFALGELAVRRQETNAAIHYFHQYLTNAVNGSAGYKRANHRLLELTGD